MLGVPATTSALAELDRSDVIVVDGVDLARQLPTVAGRVLRARLRGARLVVVDDRRQKLAEHAQLFLQLRPGTEALLYGAMAKVIVDRGLVNRQFVERRCRGFADFEAAAREHDLVDAGRPLRRAGRTGGGGGGGLRDGRGGHAPLLHGPSRARPRW